ncbi:hypothetical protein ROHU_018092 [Labeo rohita]|uniref:Uncharacterized protein n=1 Tax=Labeo rohita TaxID=84645 RepID=A0A498N716_LABRO|nr:hypothetical protein ROHU_018092 [Labeo rohita]
MSNSDLGNYESDHIPDLGAPSMARTLASVFEVLAKMTPNVLSVQRNESRCERKEQRMKENRTACFG